MKYKGKLYGKVGKSYLPLEETTKDFEKKIDLEHFLKWIDENYSFKIPDMIIQEYVKYGKHDL